MAHVLRWELRVSAPEPNDHDAGEGPTSQWPLWSHQLPFRVKPDGMNGSRSQQPPFQWRPIGEKRWSVTRSQWQGVGRGYSRPMRNKKNSSHFLQGLAQRGSPSPPVPQGPAQHMGKMRGLWRAECQASGKPSVETPPPPVMSNPQQIFIRDKYK